jgi:hypothetical protein
MPRGTDVRLDLIRAIRLRPKPIDPNLIGHSPQNVESRAIASKSNLRGILDPLAMVNMFEVNLGERTGALE